MMRALTGYVNAAGWCQMYDGRLDQLGGWGPTPSKFSPHNVECKKGEG